MPTIAISRQFGSHGDTVAQLLCERLFVSPLISSAPRAPGRAGFAGAGN